MATSPSNLVEAIQVLTLPSEVIFAEACTVLESVGFSGDMFSAGPLDRLLKYVKNELLPRIKARKDDFTSWVAEATTVIEAQLKSAFAIYTSIADQVNQDVNQYMSDMQVEGLAGPKTARVVILIATADALRKLLLCWPTPDFSVLGFQDMLMIAFCFLLLKHDAE